LQAVPAPGCLFKVHGVCSFCHALLQLMLERVSLALEKENHLMDDLLVFLPADLACAGAQATTERKIEAWSFPGNQFPALAVPQGE
jgi:hypothetical protein